MTRKEIREIINLPSSSLSDWSKRDDVRAKLRLTVKKILMRYGYPPDLAKIEADRVLAQSENLADIFSSDN